MEYDDFNNEELPTPQSYRLQKIYEIEDEITEERDKRTALCTNYCRSRAVRRRHCVGGGAPVNFGRRRRRAAGPKKSAAAAARRGVGGQKHYFLRFTKKFRSILKIFLGTFLVIKALRFADDFASGQ